LYAPTEGLIEGPVGTEELLAGVDVEVEVDDVLGGVLVEELDVVGATEELFDVLVGTVEVEELVDEVDLIDELVEPVDFVLKVEGVDLTELDELVLEDEEDLVLVVEVEELLDKLTDVDATEDDVLDVDELVAVWESQ
jgi:hypothetical protein